MTKTEKRVAAQIRAMVEMQPKAEEGYKGKVYLVRVRLNSEGYDASGTYFGVDAPLYYYMLDGTEPVDMIHSDYLRATDRAAAKKHIRSLPGLSGASFFR